MSETAAPAVAPKPKKSVALSGVIAGNSALCTVGRTGNDLHYCGYDILDLAEKCEFEEIAHLLVHGKLPTAAELKAYKTKLQSLRSIPAAVQDILECIPASTHPMDVMRTGCSALGAVLPEGEDHKLAPSRDIADRMMASFGSMLLYWHHFSHSGRRIEVETDDDSIGGHLLHLLHGRPPSESWVRAMHTSLILYAEHEFNASTFTARVVAGTGADMYSAITGGHRRAQGPEARRRQRVRLRHHRPLRQSRRGGSRHREAHRREAGDHRLRPSRSTRYPTRATRSSRKWREASRRRRAT